MMIMVSAMVHGRRSVDGGGTFVDDAGAVLLFCSRFYLATASLLLVAFRVVSDNVVFSNVCMSKWLFVFTAICCLCQWYLSVCY